MTEVVLLSPKHEPCCLLSDWLQKTKWLMFLKWHLKLIFFYILIQISPTFVPKDPIYNNSGPPYSLSGKTSYRKISWSLEAARFGFKLFLSLWNLAGTSAALLPRCLSNFRAIPPLQHLISRLRDFTRVGGKTSYRLVNRGPALVQERRGNKQATGHYPIVA